MEDNLTFVSTRCSMLLKDKVHDFQAITFESHKSKKKINTTNFVSVIGNNNDQHEFDIKKTKQEIVKFGMSGFDVRKKEDAKIQLAIKLGAKPPKNKYKNYKILKAEKKMAAQREQTLKNFQQLGKNSLGKSSAKGKSFDRKRRKEKNDILGIYGKVKVGVNKKK